MSARVLSLRPSSLRRRFQQNQDDCTITVLELLPTITTNVLEASPSEQILRELQQKKAHKLGRSSDNSEVAPSEASVTAASGTDEDGKSLSSESYVHASQHTSSSYSNGEREHTRSKVQLWNELKINCARPLRLSVPLNTTDNNSNLKGLHTFVHCITTQSAYPCATEPVGPEELPRQRCDSGIR